MSTYQQIAEMAGVSVSTVSKALAGNEEISEKTRETIFLLAEQTGYFEKRSKRKLAYTKQKTMKIVILYPKIVSANLLSEINALWDAVRNQGGRPFIYCADKTDFTKIINQFISEGVADGFIVKGMSETEKFSLPVISVSAGISRIPYSSVEIADSGIMLCDAIKYFQKKGHNKIGYAGNFEENLSKTFLLSMRKCEAKLNRRFVYEEKGSNEECGNIIADSIAKLKEKPTALFVPVYETAVVLADRLKFHGIKVPTDMSIITVDGNCLSEYDSVPLTAFQLDYRHMAECAAKQLCLEIEGKSESYMHIVCRHKLKERASVCDMDL